MHKDEFEIRPVRQGEVRVIHNLAHRVWPVTFKDILSPAQIDYMLELMYSVDSLKKQQGDGCHFFVLEKGKNPIGYLSIEHDKGGSGKTKIHKIYVLTEEHGTGAGRYLMDHAFAEAKKAGSTAVFLNVNRFNKAIGFYEYYGFKKMYTEDIDIGEGYLMEDWVMEKKSPNP